MTPYQTGLVLADYFDRLEEDRRDLLYLAWHTAAFSRSKRLPSLRKLMRPNDPAKRSKSLSEDIKAAFAAFPKA